MKALLKLFFMIIWLAAAALPLSAAIITVDPYGGGDYEKIHDAVANAAAGDTVMCASFDYVFNTTDAGVTVDKKLFIIGSGYDATADGGTSIEILASATIFTFSGTSKGSVLKGFRLKGNGTAVQVSVDDVTIEENLFINKVNAVNLNISGCKNDTVRSNIFTNMGARSGSGLTVSSATGVLINNNLFGGMARGMYSWSNTSLLIINNVFVDNGSGTYVGTDDWPYPGDSPSIYSNIYMNNAQSIGIRAGTPEINFNGFYNNGSDPSTGVTSYTGSPSFDSYTSGDVYGPSSLDEDGYDFHLASGSGYIDKGIVGVDYRDVDGSINDLGMYGGPWPFMDDFGIPTIPNVTEISVSPSSVSPGGTITITAKGRIGSGK